jgi:formiminotetrahydrofolate cyclodeaminase
MSLDFKNQTIIEFTDAAASKAPVPGGGGVSALAGSLAASLAGMVTELTIGKKKFLEYTDELTAIQKEAADLRADLLQCIARDAEAFEPLARAYSLPKETEGYTELMEQCLKTAAEPPFMILKDCVRIIEMDERLQEIGSKLAVSDAACSVMLAHGAMYGAFMNIIVNTRLMKDREYADAYTQKARDLLDTYGPRALAVYENITRRLTNG